MNAPAPHAVALPADRIVTAIDCHDPGHPAGPHQHIVFEDEAA